MKVSNSIMKLALIIFCAVLLFTTNCGKKPGLAFAKPTQHSIIAIQPLSNDYSSTQLDSIAGELARFYDSKVLILSPVTIPGHYYFSGIKQYCADSILQFLSNLLKDSAVEIIGLTHERIYTIKDSKGHLYFDENVLGLGFQPGQVCIVSDYKFNSDNQLYFENAASYSKRLKKVIMHEVGHNLGLAHCDDLNCIMSAQNGEIFYLDKCRDDYCAKCRSKIQ
jgi:archaemetzincin